MTEGKKFDPLPFIRQIKGRGGDVPYLDVKHRINWLRTEHPEAVIVTELTHVDSVSAVCRAEVTIPGGGSATGYGSETQSDFPAGYIEKAETKAIGRALIALGYGAEFASSREMADDGGVLSDQQLSIVRERIERVIERERKGGGQTACESEAVAFTLSTLRPLITADMHADFAAWYKARYPKPAAGETDQLGPSGKQEGV